MRNGFYASDQSSWKAVVLLGILALLGGRYAFQLYLDHKLDVAQAQWDVEIEQARSLAQAAQARLASLQKPGQAYVDQNKQKEIEQIRAEAHSSHMRYQDWLSQAARAKEQAEQQARIDHERAHAAGASESRRQIAALRRALDIPIQRH